MRKEPDAAGSAPEPDNPRKRESSSDEKVVRIPLSPEGSLIRRTPRAAQLDELVEGTPLFGGGSYPDLLEDYQQLVGSLPFGLTVWWLEHASEPQSFKLILANRPAERALGAPACDLLGKLMIDVLPDWFETQVPLLLREVATVGISRDLGMFPYDKAGCGARIYSSIALPLPNRCVAIVCDDVTEREQTGKLLKLTVRALSAAADAGDSNAALAQSLKAICILGGWQVGQAWVTDPEHSALFCSPEVFYSEFPIREFRKFSLLTQVSRGEDLPGVVWARWTPVWVEDVRYGEMGPRSVHARGAGLKSALGFPIISKGRLLAVVELLSSMARKTDPQMSNVVREVGTQLGVILERGELSARILRLQNEERRKIARELHDSTAQTLSALALQLSVLEVDIGNSSPASKALQTCQNLVKQASDEIQNLSHLLHPPALDEVGLSAAIHWYARELRERLGLMLELDLSSDFPRLTRDAEVALFRVFQEALSNVHRHSGCDNAVVRMVIQYDSVELQVVDHGKGIPPHLLDRPCGIDRLGVGILGMQERLKQLNGELKITSGPRGTTVTARLPRAR